MAEATDRITVNAGGRLFETTTTTLLSSGSCFFRSLLGPTGTALAAGTTNTTTSSLATRAEQDEESLLRPTKRPREDPTHDDESAVDPKPTTQQEKKKKTIFLDRDPIVFDDVLYFMRTNTIHPHAKLDVPRLCALQTEADFFAYDGLLSACDEAIKAMGSVLQKTLPAETDKKEAHFKSAIVAQNQTRIIHVDDGHVVYIVSATLAGRCKIKRYSDYPDSDHGGRKEIPGCYLNTCEKDDTGDFQLCLETWNENNTPNIVSIAHVGLDHIHADGNSPVNYDFRQNLHLCVKPEFNNAFRLSCLGSGTWNVTYWVGHPSAIPYLNNHRNSSEDDTAAVHKRRKLGEMMLSTGISNNNQSSDPMSSQQLMVMALLMANPT